MKCWYRNTSADGSENAWQEAYVDLAHGGTLMLHDIRPDGKVTMSNGQYLRNCIVKIQGGVMHVNGFEFLVLENDCKEAIYKQRKVDIVFTKPEDVS